MNPSTTPEHDDNHPSGPQQAEVSSPVVKETPVEPQREKWATAPTLKIYWTTRCMFFTDQEHMKAWQETSEFVRVYSDGLVERWNGDIDTLLVYAALFSGILTAFNVQSYPLTQPAPTDPVIGALEGISAQLGGFTFVPPSINSTQPAFIFHGSAPLPPAPWAVALNSLWFSSLIFSLSTVSIGIAVKQQLSRYDGLVGTSRHVSRLRQLRLNSLDRWYVKEVVSDLLPWLLQLALVLFLSGLLVLLWNLNRSVAIVGTVLVASQIIVYSTTIILPAFASLPAHSLALKMLLSFSHRLSSKTSQSSTLRRRIYSSIYELCLPELLWRHRNLADDARRHPHTSDQFYEVAQKAKEQKELETALLSQLGDELDGDIMVTAYTVAMDAHFLNHATVCVTDLSLDTSLTYFGLIRFANETLPGWHHITIKSLHPCVWSAAIIALLIKDPSPSSDFSSTELMESLLGYTSAYSPMDTATPVERSDRRIESSDVHRTRLFCIDFVQIIRHFQHVDKRGTTPTSSDPNPDSEESARKKMYRSYRETFYIALLDSMQRISANGMELGNDVRQSIASTLGRYIRPEFILKATHRSHQYYAIQCIVFCIPMKGSADHKADDRKYRAVQTCVLSALKQFERSLDFIPVDCLDKAQLDLESEQLRTVSEELDLHEKRVREGPLPSKGGSRAKTGSTPREAMNNSIKDTKQAVQRWIKQLEREIASSATTVAAATTTTQTQYTIQVVHHQ